PSSGSAAKVDNLWVRIREEALSEAKKEPVLAKYFCSSVLSHSSLEAALAKLLSQRLSCPDLCAETLFDVIHAAFDEDEDVKQAIRADLRAAKERDPACLSYTHCLLNFKGFQALQSHRAAHSLWGSGRKTLAVTLQSRASEVFAVDIHPAARIGRGVVIDHATGVVVGETAVVGNNVTLLHGVTLGGTGKVAGDRHPKIGDGVLVGAGSKVLGNVRVGDGAKIGAGSVVLRDVTAGSTVVGNPAKPVERKC
uniref:serine O-acetyltransferase n=1 Tax=Kalanchoe fedtschenkoi TaxID=63787 RepID=A0A7N0UBH6_KALFE